jgi:multidrug resistance efflux pump
LTALGVIAVSLLVFGFAGELPQKATSSGVLERVGDVTLQSVAEGQVRKIYVADGDNVAAGAPIVQLYGANGHLTTVRSPWAGRIAQLFTSPGSVVFVGNDLYAMIRSDVTGSGDLFAYAFLSASEVESVAPGMKVDVSPLATSQYGVIRGTVESVASAPSSNADIGRLLRNSSLATHFAVGSQPFVAVIKLQPEPVTSKNPSGVEWSNSDGPPSRLLADTVVSLAIHQGSKHPIDLVFGN